MAHRAQVIFVRPDFIKIPPDSKSERFIIYSAVRWLIKTYGPVSITRARRLQQKQIKNKQIYTFFSKYIKSTTKSFSIIVRSRLLTVGPIANV